MNRRRFLTAALASAAAVATTGGTSAAADTPLTLVMERVTVLDPMVNNMVAGTFLKPKGWKTTGGIKWYPEAYHQVCFEATVSDPDGLEQYEALAWCTATWLSRPAFPLQRMSNYMGSLYLEPMAPADVIERLTLPTARKGLRPRVVRHHDMPEVARLFARTTGGTVRAVRTRVEYVLNGQAVEEDFYLILGYASADIGGGCVSTIWGPVVPPFALRAAKGQLDAATPRLLAVAHSGWINPGWADQVGYVQSLFIQRMYNAIRDAGELSKRISRNNDYILGLMRESREYKNRVEARAAKNFSDYIRGVQGYTGGGATYTLPSGYSYAWASNTGYVVLSNDPNYNPNAGGTATWTALQPVR